MVESLTSNHNIKGLILASCCTAPGENDRETNALLSVLLLIYEATSKIRTYLIRLSYYLFQSIICLLRVSLEVLTAKNLI